MKTDQLISYIAPSAPATRRKAEGDEPFLRPEIGFTPRWYHQALGIDFQEEWHSNPLYRRETVLAMRKEVRCRFPGIRIGRIDQKDKPLDLLTGTFGACTVAGIYGIPIRYEKDGWPDCKRQYFNDEEIETLQIPHLGRNSFFQNLLLQLDRIAESEGRIEGYINWQGVLNNAHRLRGEQLFTDMIENPTRCKHLFDCVCTTMIDACKQIHERQRKSGVEIGFFTISNCLVNMISPKLYREFLLPLDQRIAKAFGLIGIHNCAWNANPYLEDYATIENVGYIDMGIQSDLRRARILFPNARRAIMYTPMDLCSKPQPEIRTDLEVIGREFGPCDIVFADIDAGTENERIHFIIQECDRISHNIPHEQERS